MCFDRIGQLAEERPGHPSDQWRDPDVEAPVLLRMDAHVVERLGGHRWSRAVDQPPAQVLRLEDLTEALDTPVIDQELQPGPCPQPPVPVVAEDPDDAGPPADRGLKLAGRVGDRGRADVTALDILDGPGRVEYLGGRDSGDWRAE